MTARNAHGWSAALCPLQRHAGLYLKTRKDLHTGWNTPPQYQGHASPHTAASPDKPAVCNAVSLQQIASTQIETLTLDDPG
jgi:hypothetical protein